MFGYVACWVTTSLIDECLLAICLRKTSPKQTRGIVGKKRKTAKNINWIIGRLYWDIQVYILFHSRTLKARYYQIKTSVGKFHLPKNEGKHHFMWIAVCVCMLNKCYETVVWANKILNLKLYIIINYSLINRNVVKSSTKSV